MLSVMLLESDNFFSVTSNMTLRFFDSSLIKWYCFMEPFGELGGFNFSGEISVALKPGEDGLFPRWTLFMDMDVLESTSLTKRAISLAAVEASEAEDWSSSIRFLFLLSCRGKMILCGLTGECCKLLFLESLTATKLSLMDAKSEFVFGRAWKGIIPFSGLSGDGKVDWFLELNPELEKEFDRTNSWIFIAFICLSVVILEQRNLHGV